MKKIILVYGSICGAVIISSMLIGMWAGAGNGSGVPQWVGYLIMLVAMVMIFVGIKRYRDQQFGGVIRFWPAFGLGLAISFVASIIYVLGWEISLYLGDYSFIEEYVANSIKAKQEAGITGAELEAYLAKMQAIKLQYAKLFFRLPMTFVEIFPVGFLVSLLSAAILRFETILPART